MYQQMLRAENCLAYYPLSGPNVSRAVSPGKLGRTYHSDLEVEWSALEHIFMRTQSRPRVQKAAERRTRCTQPTPPHRFHS